MRRQKSIRNLSSTLKSNHLHATGVINLEAVINHHQPISIINQKSDIMLKIITSLSSSILGLLAQAQISDTETASRPTMVRTIETITRSAPGIITDNKKFIVRPTQIQSQC